MSEIPRAPIAVIGGSANMNARFPEDFPGVEVITKDVVSTHPRTFRPYTRKSTATVPKCSFHGITKTIRNIEPNSASERVFYVLWKAGVKKILGTALCGSSNRLLDPADAVIPDGFVDYTTKRCQAFFRALESKGVEGERTSYRLHQSFCPELSRELYLNVKSRFLVSSSAS
jgi:purine nucleoside phosphorylase